MQFSAGKRRTQPLITQAFQRVMSTRRTPLDGYNASNNERDGYAAHFFLVWPDEIRTPKEQFMSRKSGDKGNKSKGGKGGRSDEPTYPEEERSAEAATIGWMLTTLATLVGLLCSLGAYLLVRNFAKPPPSLEILPGLLLLVSALSGLVAASLTPLVVRLRKTQPPTAITRAAVVLGLFPIVLLVVLEIIY